MSARKIRRAQAHAARKAARKTGFPTIPSLVASSTPAASDVEIAAILNPPSLTENVVDTIPDSAKSEPQTAPLSAARLAANQANAKLSKGALSPETKAISAQNHTTHGLARHQPGNFKILTSESIIEFAMLQAALITEHLPATETERILVDRMAQSHWLETRAQRLQDACIDPDTGEVTDEKKFSLYTRYQTTHTRAFHKCLNDLLKLRSEKRKAKLGVEAQRIKTERHELEKEAQSFEIMRKDASACREIAHLANERVTASSNNPEFFAAYTEELAKRGFELNIWSGATKAA